MHILLSFSIEYKTGNDRIQEYQAYNYFNKTEDHPTKNIERKYDNFLSKFDCRHSAYVFSLSKILRYIEKGDISNKELNEEIKSNAFFREDEEHDWEKLWWWRRLDETVFNDLLEKVWEEYSNNEIHDPISVLHIAGIYLNLNNLGLFDTDKQIIVNKAKHSIAKLFNDNTELIESYFAYDFNDNSYGKEYQAYDTQEFKEINAYFYELVRKGQDNYASQFIKQLFENLTEESLKELNSKLKEVLPDSSGCYGWTPVFKSVNGRILGEKIVLFSNDSIWYFKDFLHQRYNSERRFNNTDFEMVHKDEIDCLVDLKSVLAKSMQHSKPIKKFSINELGNEIDKIIEKLHNI